MEYVTLGRTGLRVSVAGLGCGGHSRLGQAHGRTKEESADVVRRALDLGVTLVDTAFVYGTERIVGAAIAGRRDEVVVSTKCRWGAEGLPTPDDLTSSLEKSLERLGTDAVDVYFLHGLPAEQYDRAVETLVPALERARREGKVRFYGVTEQFNADTTHRMLARAAADDCWDVVMVGFNMLNQSAAERVFPKTLERGIGTMDMFAVRRALRTAEEALEMGGVDLSFLLDHASSLTEAAYRFVRHTPGVDVVLTGTGSVEHLEQNVRAILGPPLPDDVIGRVASAFAGRDDITGN